MKTSRKSVLGKTSFFRFMIYISLYLVTLSALSVVLFGLFLQTITSSGV